MIKWKDAYVVGIKSIDADHARLFDILNEIEQSISSLKKQPLSPLLEKLEKYAETHFKDEQKHMIKNNYPKDKFEVHRKEHELFIKNIKEIEDKADSTLTFVTMSNIMNYLKDWVIEHILGTDREFADFLKQK